MSRKLRCAGLALFLFMIIAGASDRIAAQQSPDQQSPAPDNTSINRGNQPTADQQKFDRSDREIVRRIRRAIIKDKSLSAYAHNVKVIVTDGAVTLKGPVRSEDEKAAIESKATEVAGEGKVTNELQVAPKK